jgi:hypothetical protein
LHAVADGAGIVPKGRVRIAVHSPEATSSARSASGGSVCGASAPQPSNATCAAGPSSAATSITIDRNARISPRLIAATMPAAGAVKRTSGFLRSVNRSVPRSTRSPGWTASAGLSPG